MNKKTLIFDFDGTLVDSFNLVVETYNSIANEFNCLKVDESDLTNLRDARPQEHFKRYGISILKLPKLLLRGRRELNNKINELCLKNGLEQILYKIYKSGLRFGILSSNSRKNVKTVLAKHKIGDLFSFIWTGRHLFGKDKILRTILKKEKIDPTDAMYIGDETRDMEAAKKAGIKCAAVTWGFNSKKALEMHKPDFMINKPEDLLSLV